MPDKPLRIDFGSAANTYRRLHGGGGGQAIAKAIGLKTYGLPLRVIDATAGLGQDAFVLACLGVQVTMIERNPIIANLLAEAIQNGMTNPTIQHVISSMELIEGDAHEVLQRAALKSFADVIYLDPMFPKREKSALVKQELRVLKDLVGQDDDADSLLPIAQSIAKRRVVVKRPRIAPFLNNQPPFSQLLGKANRFDIYMPN